MSESELKLKLKPEQRILADRIIRKALQFNPEITCLVIKEEWDWYWTDEDRSKTQGFTYEKFELELHQIPISVQISMKN